MRVQLDRDSVIALHVQIRVVVCAAQNMSKQYNSATQQVDFVSLVVQVPTSAGRAALTTRGNHMFSDLPTLRSPRDPTPYLPY
eukprot:6652995-Pyramimonas_sp.AAC.1